MSVNPTDLSEFTDADLSDRTDAELVEALQDRGWVVTKDEPAERHIEVDAPPEGRVRIAVASDTHLGSKYQQLTHLRDFCAKAGEWKADLLIHGGDVVDGTHKMHRGMEFEQFQLGARAQGRYAIEHLPEVVRRDGRTKSVVPWRIIGGNHDGSFFKDAGADVLGQLADARDDVDYLGAPAAVFHVGPLRIEVRHPNGGVPYARSYKPQKLVEQIAPDEKPHLLFFGHWHVPIHVPGYRNVEAITLPCFQSQTPYLKMLGLAPVLGGLLLEAEYDASGLRDFTTRWLRYHRPVPRDYGGAS